MQERPLASYEDLVFRITGKSFRKDGSNVTQGFRDRIKSILSEYKGFICVSYNGSISTVRPKDIICDNLLANGHETGYYISSKDGHVHSVPLPMKEVKNQRKCPPTASVYSRTVCTQATYAQSVDVPEGYGPFDRPFEIARDTETETIFISDSAKINEVLKEFGVRPLYNPNIRKLAKGEFEATWRTIDNTLNRKWLMEALTENFVRKAHIMNNFYEDMAPHALPETFDDTLVLDYAMNNKGCYYDKRILSDDTIAKTMDVYNSAVIYRTILGEEITEFPKDSDAVLLARRIIPYLPYKTDNQWESSNVTWSMHEENLDKSDIMAAITKIGRPGFEREPGNKNTKTFDRIRIFFSLMGKKSMPARDKELRLHQKDLARIAIAKIKDSKQFQRYDIPINFLKVDHMTITCQDELEIVFVLKSIPKEENDDVKTK